jgi:hypothetical protein
MWEEHAAGTLLSPQPCLLNSTLNAHSNSLIPTQTPAAPVAQQDLVASFTGIAGSGAALMLQGMQRQACFARLLILTTHCINSFITEPWHGNPLLWVSSLSNVSQALLPKTATAAEAPPPHPNTHQSIQATTPDAISHLAAWVHQHMMSLQCCEQNGNCTGGCTASTVLHSSLYCSHLRSMQDGPLGSKHCIDMDSLLPSALNGRRTS